MLLNTAFNHANNGYYVQRTQPIRPKQGATFEHDTKDARTAYIVPAKRAFDANYILHCI
jgi:hypothetical protein